LSSIYMIDLRNREFEYFQFKNGLLDESTWSSYRNIILVNHSSGRGRIWWNVVGRPIVNPEFARLVDELLVNAEADHTYENFASWDDKEFEQATSKAGGRKVDTNKDILIAESFIDSFYSFEPAELRAALLNAGESAPAILYYQGWAEGGNYEVVNRMPCVAKSPELVSCSITVKDDLISALGTGFDVTDTFSLSFSAGKIVAVETSSNDPQEFHEARDWVRTHRPELIEVPCRDYFNGGPTPGQCVQAMVQGYKEYVGVSNLDEEP